MPSTQSVRPHDPLLWLSLNLEYGGVDFSPAAPHLRTCGSVDLDRLHWLPGLAMLPGKRPDVIFLQEGKRYDRSGSELLLYTERLLRRAGVGMYRGLLTRSLHNDLHQVVYVNVERIEVAHHWCGADPDEGGRRYGFVELLVDGDDERPILAKSIHLDPRDGNHRLAQTRHLHGAVKEHGRAIIAGDFNSSTSRRSANQGEPMRDFAAMSPRDRYGKGLWPPLGPDGSTVADTAAVDYLLDVGWTDQHIVDSNVNPTVRPGVDRGGDLIIDRCLTYGGLETVPGSVTVDEPNYDVPYSDHLALWGALTITD